MKPSGLFKVQTDTILLGMDSEWFVSTSSLYLTDGLNSRTKGIGSIHFKFVKKNYSEVNELIYLLLLFIVIAIVRIQ